MSDLSTQESDAQILWDDVTNMLEEEGMAPATLAMLRSCTAEDLTEDTLTISVKGAFVKRNVERNAPIIEDALERAAFQHFNVCVTLAGGAPSGNPSATRPSAAQQQAPTPQAPAPQVMPASMPHIHQTQTTISREELERLMNPSAEPVETQAAPSTAAPRKNPLVGDIAPEDSELTFETFIEGEENRMALQAAKAVANGSHAYNPLFIYGGPGMGKTHLLKAIQNYLAVNDPERVCVYRTATEFVNDYSTAMVDTTKDVKQALTDNYHGVDVLIIDDIQGFRSKAGSVQFFFDTFNFLTSHGKQIVLAADKSPIELGLEERVSTRLDSGVTISIQVPNYELKLGLLRTFYKRMKDFARETGDAAYDGELTEEDLEFMAERSGASIRTIKSFCQVCILEAANRQRGGLPLTREDITKIAEAKWGANTRTFTIEQIQKFVETRYNVSHADLVGDKRNKTLMEPRHVAVWLARELTDSTLADIGERFGGRTHATVKHSLKWVEERRTEDRIVYDKIMRLKEDLMASS